jgi:hypothetical protein
MPALGAGGGNHRRRGQIQPRALPQRPRLHGAGREAGIHHFGGRDQRLIFKKINWYCTSSVVTCDAMPY